MTKDLFDDWSRFAPNAPELAAGKKWHVFLSYRSVYRTWVISLYDILKDLGYEVFLDQFVLRANDNLTLALQRGLDDSMSGILIWSQRTEDSKWCEKEFATMDQKATEGTFHYGVAKLDHVTLPAFASARLYADFSDSPDGPQGSNLLRLIYGIVNKPPSDEAVRFGTQIDEEIHSAAVTAKAAREVGNVDKLIELSRTDSVAWKSTPMLGCLVAESLARLGEYEAACVVVKELMGRFPKAVRPRQLLGHALARKGATEDAQLVLGELEAEGNRDPETLGMLARTWMDRYNETNVRSFLRKSRNLYQLAFEHTPSDSYVGINAAAKSVFLGELDIAASIAADVEKLVGTKPHAGDYWQTATAAEIQLIRKEYGNAAGLYQAAVDISPLEYGSQRSTLKQARLLLEHLGATDVEKGMIEKAFEDLPPGD